jgi:4,5:9,10-diseco-3-hydroxy-5,9,17-trioxoandrosta-1(10),2-diene-4-oate hydrolase
LQEAFMNGDTTSVREPLLVGGAGEGAAVAPGAARAAAGTGADHRDAIIDGVRVAYEDDGSGTPLVCLHALGHGAGDSAPFRRRYRDRYRVLALDWPGHGRSDGDFVPTSSARYGELLERFIDGLGLDAVTLVGNSIGGAAAIRFAAARPERVRALVVCNPGGLARTGLVKRLFTRTLSRIFAAGARGARWYPWFFRAYTRRVLAAPPAAEQRDRVIAAGREMAPLLAAGWHSFGEPGDDVRPLLARVACPVLVTWSLGDPVNPLRFNRPALRLLPSARLELFRGGHAPFLENPVEFDAAFDSFVKELP